MGLTKQAVSVRVKKLVANASLYAPGLLGRIKQAAVLIEENDEFMTENEGFMTEGVTKKSIPTAQAERGTSTTAKKRKDLKDGQPETYQG
jgi:hypothetical protein